MMSCIWSFITFQNWVNILNPAVSTKPSGIYSSHVVFIYFAPRRDEDVKKILEKKIGRV